MLVIRDPNSASLLVSLPAVAADAESFEMLARELALIYSEQREQLPEPFRYVQFAQWQADLLQSDEDEAKHGRETWKRWLTEKSGVLPALPAKEGRTKRLLTMRQLTFRSKETRGGGSAVAG